MIIKMFHLTLLHSIGKALSLTLCLAIFYPLQATNYQTINLPLPEEHSHWQQMIKSPSSVTEFFLANTQGKIFIYDAQRQISPLVDIKSFFPKLITLTAITTHPSFKLSQQHGFNTFYSAHIQTSDSKNSQLSPRYFSEKTPYQLVISEWQLADNQASTSITHNKHKIILRIAVPTPNVKVQQLAFNPFIQSWQDNYGQLLITLSADPRYHNQPLYSGAILRISPEKFGTKNYRIPQSNPFIEQQEINNEILVANLGKIHSTYWLKTHTDQLFINHSIKQKLSWSTVIVGTDFVKSSDSADSFFTTPETLISNSLLYRGSKFKNQRNKSLYLKWQEQWQLMSLSSQPPYQEKVLQKFSLAEIPADARLILTLDHLDEPIIFNQSTNILLSLADTSHPDISSSEQTADTQVNKVQAQIYLLVGFLLLAVCALIFFSKRSALPAIKKYLHNRYAKFEVEHSHISLYQRHRKEPSCQLDFTQITESAVYLNGEPVFLVNSQPENAFSNQQEQAVLAAIAKEKREKMIDSRIRKCELHLTDSNNNHYRVCNYFRKGNQRLTKTKFDQATEQLIDWCWKISTIINPDHTKARTIASKPEIKLVKPSNPPLDIENKQSSISPAQEQSPSSNTAETNNSSNLNRPTKTSTHTVNLSQAARAVRSSAQQALQQDIANLSMVEALEKLAKLKQQELLSDEEFELAKSKLLNLPSNES